MINIGSQLETGQRAVELAEKYSEGVFASVGLHPIHITGHLMKKGLDSEELAAQEKMKEFNVEDYKKLAESKKMVAIGEIGLDYYYKPKSKTKLTEFKEIQQQGLVIQLDMAQDLNLPVALHCRSAHDDLISILNTKYHISGTNLRGVIHCFTGNLEQMEKYLNLGLYLGLNGIIFKPIPGINWQQIIKEAPLDRILIETDSPYLTPPMAKQSRNEPIFSKYVIVEIAKIKKLSYEEVAKITTRNARTLFNI